MRHPIVTTTTTLKPKQQQLQREPTTTNKLDVSSGTLGKHESTIAPQRQGRAANRVFAVCPFPNQIHTH